MSCKISIKNAGVVKALSNLLGERNMDIIRYLSEVLEDDTHFNSEFSEYFYKHNGTFPSIDSKAKILAENIKNFYNTKYLNVAELAKISSANNFISHYGYTKNAARNEALNNAIGTISFLRSNIEITKDIKQKIKDGTIKTYFDGYKEYYIDSIMDSLLNTIPNSTYTFDEFYKDIREEYVDFNRIEIELGNEPNIQQLNQLALLKELIDKDGKFFKQLMIVPSIAELSKDKDLFKDIQLDQEDTQENLNETEENDSQTDQKDYTVTKHNSHLGDINNYRALISEDLKTLFSSLLALNSTKTEKTEDGQINYDLKTGTLSGLPVFMTAQQCENILFQHADKTNVDKMIKSIKTISEIKGYEAFIQLYDICFNQPEVAYKLFSNFSRCITETTETLVESGDARARTSNRRVSAKTILRFDFINDFKIQVSSFSDGKLEQLRVYNNTCNEILGLQKTQSTEFAKNEERLLNILYHYLSFFANNITENDIIAYINKFENKFEAYSNLKRLCVNLSKEYKESYKEYVKRQTHIGELRVELFRRQKENNNIAVNTIQKELSELYKQEFVTNNAFANIFEIADKFAEVKDVHIDLNNKNVHGNNRSSVLNNNLIGQFARIMDNPELILAKGKELLKSNQYKYSNLFFPQYNEQQILINTPIFTYDNDGNLALSENYRELLVSRLYDGAGNLETGDNATYSEMSGTDYLTSAYINFVARENIGGHIDTAAYFSRTPSDSPNIYSHSMRRYANIEGNISCAKLDLSQEQEQKYLELKKKEVSYGEYQDIHIIVDEEQGLNILRTNKGPLYIRKQDERNKKKDKHAYDKSKLKNGEKVSVHLAIANNNYNKASFKEREKLQQFTVYYEITGTYKNDKIYNYKVTAIKVSTNPTNVKLINQVSDIYKTNFINTISNNELNVVVNTKTVIFNLYKNAFKQELLNAATALYEIFNCIEKENEDGSITASVKLQANNTLPEFKFDLLNKENPTEEEQVLIQNYFKSFYEHYHYTETKKHSGIYAFGRKEKINTGAAEFILTGNVFKSDRFINVVTKNGKVEVINRGQNIIDEAIHFLYGGGTDANKEFKFKVENSKVVDIILNEYQESIIDKHLTAFIQDTVRQGEERLKSIKEFVPSTIYTENNRIEFILNYGLAFMNYADVFEGDSKFYPNSQNFLKRAKEIQAAGIPYGNSDLYDLLTPKNTKSAIYTVKRPGTNEDYIVDIASNKIAIRNKFTAITIANSITNQNGELTNHLINKLKEIFIKQNYSEKDAQAKAEKLIDGYKNITANDAQSYITFDEWIRRVTLRGQLEEYRSLIEKIYNNEKLNGKELETFIQVQKNFYYDVAYDNERGIYVPRQIKNAEFVLIPQLIQGTELEKVYNLMKTNNIDQINTSETSKAAKRNVIELFDENGYLIKSATSEINSDEYKTLQAEISSSAQLYSYSNLYTQLDNPQHLNAQNKAGIQIMKKILDNIDENSPLYQIKTQFINLYVENIKESHTELMKEFGIEGDIKYDSTGRIEGFNYNKFFEKFEQELLRRGLNSNMFDYVTYDETSLHGLTKMPFYMSNVDSLFQNIAQSIFNNAITRQKLPGFHGVQVTRIGWKGHVGVNKTLKYHPEVYKFKTDDIDIYNHQYISIEDYKKLSEDEQSKYELTTAPYIEILLPKANFKFNLKKEDGTNKTDQELIEELKQDHLDEIIGYRMPTEGKQSIAIMKIVGFIPDANGSTIIVPDEWVAQTGADFDVDSIYGIHYTTYLDKNKKIRRIRYNTYDRTNSDRMHIVYNNYVTREIKKLTSEVLDDTKYNEQIKDEKERQKAEQKKQIYEEYKQEVKNNRDEEIKSAQEEQDKLFSKLPKYIQDKKKKIDANYKETSTKEDKYKDLLEYELDELTIYLENGVTNEDDKKLLEEYIDTLYNLKWIIYDSREINDEEFNEGLVERLQTIRTSKNEIIEKIINNRNKRYSYYAKKYGLMTYSEFTNKSDLELNSKDARNNEILKSIITILGHDLSLEENLSRSNFEDIIDARDGKKNPNTGKRENGIINNEIKKQRDARSPYNIFDQANYQYDAMSGAMLKAFSVKRDTFCSICNTVKAVINNTKKIKITYKLSDLGVTAEELKRSYPDAKINGNEVIIEHTRFGWSADNHNVEGKLLTTYSSETTAHILDAIKEGNVPNVNEYTFQVYKMFPDVGSNYRTAIAFMAQPVVSRICEEYNKSNSIYCTNNSNPIKTVLISLVDSYCKYFNKTYDEKEVKSISDYIDLIKSFKDEQLNDLIGTDIEINETQLRERIDNSSPVGEIDTIRQDIAIVIKFNDLYNIASKINDYTMVCNPDKFGAKQTLFATREILSKIVDIKAEENPILQTSNGINLISSIYTDKLDNSSYKMLNAFIKYATETSVAVNTHLFPTQREGFRSYINEINNEFKTRRIPEAIYTDYQRYILSYYYGQTSFVKNGISFIDGKFVIDDNIDVIAEKERIFGYNKSAEPTVQRISTIVENGETKEIITEIPFNVEDLTNPTEQEIKDFSTLSPAQKVKFLKNRISGISIFSYIIPNLANFRQYAKKSIGTQTLSISDTANDEEVLFNMFNDAFNSTNPFIALAAADILKYAVVVEGFQYKRNSINKIIPNDILLNDINNNGTGFINDLNNLLATCFNGADTFNSYEHYLRSHHKNIKEMYKIYITTEENKQEFLSNGLKITEEIGTTKKEENSGLIVLGKDSSFFKDIPETINYVNIINNKINTLYRIIRIEDKVFLYPLNNLELTEASQWSTNPDNNIHPGKDYYTYLIYEAYKDAKDNELSNSFVDLTTAKLMKQINTYTNEYEVRNVEQEDLNYDINSEEFESTKRDIISAFKEDLLSDRVYTRDIRLFRALYNKKSIQTININGETVDIELKQEILDTDHLENYTGKSIRRILDSGVPHNIISATKIKFSTVRAKHSTVRSQAISTANATNAITKDLLDASLSAIDVIINESRKGNKSAIDTLGKLKYNGITRNTFTANSDTGLALISSYVSKLCMDLNDRLNYFYKIGEYSKNISDSEIIEKIKTDEELFNAYVKLLVEARAIYKQFGNFKNLKIEVQDENTKIALEHMQKQLTALFNNKELAEAETRLANEVLPTKSTNPLVRAKLINVLENFNMLSTVELLFHDTRESTNTLVQIMLNEVENDITKKEMLAKRQSIAFRKKCNDIIAKAKKDGLEINFDKMIDKDGKWIPEYNQQFKEKLVELQEQSKNTEQAFNDLCKRTDYTIEEYKAVRDAWIEAKFNYDVFKFNYTEQLLDDTYYATSLAEQYNMLQNHREIYCEYIGLMKQRNMLYNIKNNISLTDELSVKLRSIESRLSKLQSEYSVISADKDISFEELIFTVNSLPDKKIEDIRALKAYVSDMKHLKEEYFERTAKVSFEAAYNDHLNRVLAYKAGNKDILEDDYNKSLEWIRENVRFVRTDASYEELRKAYALLKENPYDSNGINKSLRDIYKDVPNLFDEFGTLDATKLSEEQIAKIKAMQESRHFINGRSYNETFIINVGEKTPFVFNSTFYSLGVGLSSEKNVAYLEKVKQVNNILRKYAKDGLNIQQISHDELIELAKLFDEIDAIKEQNTTTKEKATAMRKFIEENVDFSNNEDQFTKDQLAAKSRGPQYYEAFMKVAMRTRPEYDEETHKMVTVPEINHYLYGSMKPLNYNEDEYARILAKDPKDRTKAENETIKFVNEDSSKALRIIDDNCVYNITKYYQETYVKYNKIGGKVFEDWYNKNHVYNPYRHKMEPLKCWLELSTDPTDYHNVDVQFTAEPRYIQTESRAKEDKLNKNYKGEKSSIASNYRTTPVKFDTINIPARGNSVYERQRAIDLNNTLQQLKNNTNYNNTEISLNQYEQEMKNYFKQIIDERVKTNSGRQFINEGYVPLKANDTTINGKVIRKEIAKLVGWTYQNKDDIEYTSSDRVDYAFDPEITMPMLSTLSSSDFLKFDKVEPKRFNYESDEEFNKAVDEYNKAKEEYEKELEKAQQNLIDRDFISVMEDFINKAGTYNAIQENKYKLYYTKNMLENTLGYARQSGTNKLQLIDPSNPEKGYSQTIDKNAIEQLTMYIRRRLLNQYKENNNVMTRTANLMQSLTSAKFMAFNVMGGIANVNLGNVNIFMEAVAKDYLGAKDWFNGRLTYDGGAMSYLRDMYSPEATTVQSAIIQWMNVVDFDDYAEIVRTPSLKEKFKRGRDLTYICNSAGEHRMQNSVMFGLMHSHRVIPADKTKSGKIEILNEAQYIRNNREMILQQMLEESSELKQKYDTFVKYSTETNTDEKAKYATFRDDLTSKFVRLYLGNSANEYFKRVEDANEKSKQEFETFETLIEQYELKDGYLDFKTDKSFGKISIDEAIDLTAKFRNKVISVNKEIHGVYDRLGAATLEAKWYGSILMQYKKHLPMGIAKHYRRLGYYNEARDSVEKGMFVSLIDFISMPFRDKKFIKDLKEKTPVTDEELSYLVAVQNLATNALNLASTYKLCWKSLTDYDKHNIIKMLGELLGATSAIALAIATHAIADDDDEDEILYNLSIYEADRLASESVMYHPLGLVSEGKKLWSSPIAMQNGVDDLLNSLGFCVQCIWQGKDFNWTYKTGLYAGEHKLKTKVLKQIPVVRQVYNFKRLSKNNKYYKYDKNMLSIVPVKEIGDTIGD